MKGYSMRNELPTAAVKYAPAPIESVTLTLTPAQAAILRDRLYSWGAAITDDQRIQMAQTLNGVWAALSAALNAPHK
jgi:hypothetical protein